jgi:hypothetical protein
MNNSVEGRMPPQETNPDNSELEILEIMETRHQNAIVAFQIEEILKTEVKFTGFKSTKNDLKKLGARARAILEKTRNNMPDIKYVAFRKAIARYLGNKYSALCFEAQQKIEYTANGNKFTPETFGSRIFELKTGRKNYDIVTAERQEGFFVVTCTDQTDYDQFLAGKAEVDEEKPKTGGMYYRSVQLSLRGETAPVLCLNKCISEPRNIEHERQHFLNIEIYKNFDGIDSDRDLVDIKNEILAFVRGDRREDIYDISKSKLYEHLFINFTEERKKEIFLLIEKIGNELKNLSPIFTSSDQKLSALLTYLLLDVPLSKFPKRLASITKFYDKKIHDIIKTQITVKDINNLKLSGKLADFRLKVFELMNLETENYALLLGIIVNEEDRVKYERIATRRVELKKDIGALVDQSTKFQPPIPPLV